MPSVAHAAELAYTRRGYSDGGPCRGDAGMRITRIPLMRSYQPFEGTDSDLQAGARGERPPVERVTERVGAGYCRGAVEWRVCEGDFDAEPSLSGTLCVRHSMTTRSMYAEQEDDEGGAGRSGGDAVHPQGTLHGRRHPIAGSVPAPLICGAHGRQGNAGDSTRKAE